MGNLDWVEILEDARVGEGVVASAASSAPGPVWVELPADPPLVSPAARGFLCLCLSALASFCICHSVFGPCVRWASITQLSVSQVSAQFCLLCVLCHFIPLFFVCLCICTFVWQFDLRITISIVFTFVFMPTVTLLWDNLESQFVLSWPWLASKPYFSLSGMIWHISVIILFMIYCTKPSYILVNSLTLKLRGISLLQLEENLGEVARTLLCFTNKNKNILTWDIDGTISYEKTQESVSFQLSECGKYTYAA